MRNNVYNTAIKFIMQTVGKVGGMPPNLKLGGGGGGGGGGASHPAPCPHPASCKSPTEELRLTTFLFFTSFLRLLFVFRSSVTTFHSFSQGRSGGVEVKYVFSVWF